MSLIKIIIDSDERKIRVSRKVEVNAYQEQYIIPDKVSVSSNIEVEDTLLNGTSILYPNLYLFPRDLGLFIGKEIKFQLTDGSQITGIFISFEDSKDTSTSTTTTGGFGEKGTITTAAPPTAASTIPSQRVIIDATKCHSEKLTKDLPNGLISIATSHIQSYFPSNFELNDRSTIIKFNDTLVREIIVSYDIPFSNDSFSSGFFRHHIKGIDFKALYSDPNLEANIPITFKTVYYWVPQWDIERDGVTLSLVSESKKESFTVNNFKCRKNYLNQIVVNQFSSTATRAVLVYPLGAIRISLFFQNNSDYILNNITKINFGTDLDIVQQQQQQQPPPPTFTTFGKTSSPSSSLSQSSYLLNQVQPNQVGVISFNFDNKVIKVYKDIAHQPLYDTKTRDFTITNIKISNIFTLVDTETRSKVNFQFVNATDYKTKYLVYLGKSDQEQNSNITANGKEIDSQSLYLFDSFPLSISSFQIAHSQKKTFMTLHKLPIILINYLKEKGIQINLNKDKFETYDLSNLDRNTQDTIFKLMGSLYLEEKTSNYFNRNIELSISQSLFSDSNFNKPLTSLNSNVGLFGSSAPQQQQQQQQPSTFGFGNTFAQQQLQHQPATSLFGASSSPFGAAQQQVQSFGFGSSTSQHQPQQSSSGLFGSAPSSAPQSSSGLFGSTPSNAPSSGLFGTSSSIPQSSSTFGSVQPAVTATTTTTPSTFGFGSSQTTAPTAPTQSAFSFGGSQTTSPTSSATPSFGFGSTTPSSFGFGSTTSSQNNSDTESTSSFVSVPSSPQTVGSQNTPASLITVIDSVQFASITAKDEYSNKSFEELKHEYNEANKPKPNEEDKHDL